MGKAYFIREYKRALLSLYLIMMVIGCTDHKDQSEISYLDLPLKKVIHLLNEDDTSLKPIRLHLKDDTIFVSYMGRAGIDLFATTFEMIGSIAFTDPDQIFPTDFFISDSQILVCDHSQQVLVVYDRFGNYINSYSRMPDNKVTLSPFSLTYYNDVVYVGDPLIQKVLAISMADIPEVTEKGELVLTFAGDALNQIVFPSALMVTSDGRLLIGDAGTGSVSAYTCSGRFIYNFEIPELAGIIAPQGIAVDDVQDPSLSNTESFDPSGVPGMGRIHIVDANNGKIHMFNPLGSYLASYPLNETLNKPSDIAIDTASNKIFVIEAAAGRVLEFVYRDNEHD